jgi:hypothetical protein
MRRTGPRPTPRQCGQLEWCQIGTQVSDKGVLTRSTDAVTSLFETRVRPVCDLCATRTSPVPSPLDSLDLDGEPFTAFSATRPNDITAATRFHSYQKTMGTFASGYRGLERAFHRGGLASYRKKALDYSGT